MLKFLKWMCHAGCEAYKTRLAYSVMLMCVKRGLERLGCVPREASAYESNPEKIKEAARKEYNANSKYK